MDSSQSLVVRQANANDANQISKLGSLVFSRTFGHSVEPHHLQAYLEESYGMEATVTDIENPLKSMFVATEGADGEIVGFALLTRGSSEPCVEHLKDAVELQRIYVHPDRHRNGAGRKLATSLEALAKQEGFVHMWLGVWQENHKARQVYEKWGYKKVGVHDFTIGGIVQTDDIMLKQL